MTTAVIEQPAPRAGGRRGFLLTAIVILLAIFIGILYLLWTMINVPEHKPVLANMPGVKVEFQAFGGSFGKLDHPLGVTYDPTADRIYVTEPTAGKVVVFDGEGKNGRLFVQDDSRVNKKATVGGNVMSPEGIDVGADGTVFVADPAKNAVVAFNSEGRKLREMKFTQPVRVTVSDNKLYVLCSPGTLFITTLQGQTINRFGTQGTTARNLYGPTGVVVDKGNLYIADSQNFRLLALDSQFKPLWNFGQPKNLSDASMSSRPIELPTGVTLGEDGNIYVVDGMASQIMVFDKAGKVVSSPLSKRGDADDQLALPQTIKSMKDDLFVVADQFHNRVVGFRLHPQPIESKTGK